MAGERLMDGKGRPLFKWQIRIRSEEPVLIEFSEQHFGPVAPMGEVYTLVRRTSYQVEGPNREVWWAVDIWKDDKWVVVTDGKSRLKADMPPQ